MSAVEYVDGISQLLKAKVVNFRGFAAQEHARSAEAFVEEAATAFRDAYMGAALFNRGERAATLDADYPATVEKQFVRIASLFSVATSRAARLGRSPEVMALAPEERAAVCRLLAYRFIAMSHVLSRNTLPEGGFNKDAMRSTSSLYMSASEARGLQREFGHVAVNFVNQLLVSNAINPRRALIAFCNAVKDLAAEYPTVPGYIIEDVAFYNRKHPRTRLNEFVAADDQLRKAFPAVTRSLRARMALRFLSDAEVALGDLLSEVQRVADEHPKVPQWVILRAAAESPRRFERRVARIDLEVSQLLQDRTDFSEEEAYWLAGNYSDLGKATARFYKSLQAIELEFPNAEAKTHRRLAMRLMENATDYARDFVRGMKAARKDFGHLARSLRESAVINHPDDFLDHLAAVEGVSDELAKQEGSPPLWVLQEIADEDPENAAVALSGFKERLQHFETTYPQVPVKHLYRFALSNEADAPLQIEQRLLDAERAGKEFDFDEAELIDVVFKRPKSYRAHLQRLELVPDLLPEFPLFRSAELLEVLTTKDLKEARSVFESVSKAVSEALVHDPHLSVRAAVLTGIAFDDPAVGIARWQEVLEGLKTSGERAKPSELARRAALITRAELQPDFDEVWSSPSDSSQPEIRSGPALGF